MRLKMLFLMSGAIFVCGCSSSPKQLAAGTPATNPVAPVKAEVPAKVVVPKNEMICNRGEEKRLLEVESLEPKGCKLWYARYDNRSSVASSALGNAYCEKVRENIRTKLVGAGFECMTVQSAGAPPVVTASPSPTATVSDVQKKAEPPKK